jgi:hypothetical protein
MGMKLAEALLLGADRNRTYEQLRARIQASARYQEGEQPPEDAKELVDACYSVLDELEHLIRQINRTNALTSMPDGRTVTDALAERDVLCPPHQGARRADPTGQLDNRAGRAVR